MNYQKIYDLIISKATNRVNKNYVESHHIIPKFMGGTDSLENLIHLTPREHFICHLLLTKIVPENKKYAAVKSVYMMLSWSYSNQNRLSITPGLSKKIIRVKFPSMPQETKQKISEATINQFKDPIKRKKHLDGVMNRYSKPEELKKLSNSQNKRFSDPNEREKISKALKTRCALIGSPNKGRSFDHLSIEERNKLFGSKNRGRIQTQAEKDKRANSIRKFYENKKLSKSM